MLGLDIPIRTPTSFLFFAASAFATYFASEVDTLRWFAYAGFAIFLALGPALWIAAAIGALEVKGEERITRRSKWKPIGDTPADILIGWFFGIVQIILFGAGSYFGAWGLFSLS